MDMKINGIIIPIWYSTNNPQRQGYLEMYFGQESEIIDKSLPAALKNAWLKADQQYRKSQVYGYHQFLVPVMRDGWMANFPMGSMQIGNNPTTAVQFEKCQLMPCHESNLSLISQLQSQPFYIEITKRCYYIHVLLQGMYRKIPSQKSVPKNWVGFSRPVITLVTESGPVHFSNFSEIPWADIGNQLGRTVQPLEIIESPYFSNN